MVAGAHNEFSSARPGPYMYVRFQFRDQLLFMAGGGTEEKRVG